MKGIVTPQGVAADQLRQAVCLVRRCGSNRAHLRQLDRDAPICQLEGTLTASQSTTYDGYRTDHTVGDYKSGARAALIR